MLKHIGTVHLDARFSCDECSIGFKTKREFNDHECKMLPLEIEY